MLQEGLRADPKGEELWNDASYSYAEAGKAAAALDANDRYISLRPNDPAPMGVWKWASLALCSVDLIC